MILLSIFPSSQSASGDALAGSIVLLMMAIVWGVRKYPHKLSTAWMLIALILCLVHYIFPQTGGDFNAYKEWVEMCGYTNTKTLSMYYLHFERIYYDIVNFVHNDYFLFRLIVWGGSLVLFCLTAWRLKLDSSTFYFFLCICIVPLTSTSRVTLAYGIAYFGFSLIVKPITRKGSNTLSFVIGSLLIMASLYFHRSAIFFLLTLPLSLIDYNKKMLRVLPFAFIALVVVLNANLYEYLFAYNQTDDSLFDAQTANSYLQADKKIYGVGHLLRLFLRYLTVLAIGFLLIKCILNKTYNSLPTPTRKYANVTLLTIVIASAFLLTSGNTYKTFERFIGFCTFPQCVVLSFFLKNDIEKKLVNGIILLITGYVVYGTIYDLMYLGGV